MVGIPDIQVVQNEWKRPSCLNLIGESRGGEEETYGKGGVVSEGILDDSFEGNEYVDTEANERRWSVSKTDLDRRNESSVRTSFWHG